MSNETDRGRAREEWKSIPGYEGFYDVSNIGRVRSLVRTGRYGQVKRVSPLILKPNMVRGHRRVGLYKNGKSKHRTISRLVLLAFIGPPKEKYDAAHLNGNSLDDRVENLAWVTHHENILHKAIHGTVVKGERHHKAKITEAQAASIVERKKAGARTRDLVREFGLCRENINRIAKGTLWAHLKRPASAARQEQK